MALFTASSTAAAILTLDAAANRPNSFTIQNASGFTVWVDTTSALTTVSGAYALADSSTLSGTVHQDTTLYVITDTNDSVPLNVLSF